MAAVEFLVPTDEEFIDTFGISPEPLEDEPTVSSIRLNSTSGEEAVITYDEMGRSFRIQIFSEGNQNLDILRESATRLSIRAEGSILHISVKFESEDLFGELKLAIGDRITLRDQLLIR